MTQKVFGLWVSVQTNPSFGNLRLIVDDVNSGSRGRLLDLLSKDLRRTTVLLWIIWTTAAFAYYGVVLMSTELFNSPGQLCSIDGKVG